MMAPRDTMAEYIRQLLVLDESSLRENLQSLSAYADTKSGNGVPDTVNPVADASDGHEVRQFVSDPSCQNEASGEAQIEEEQKSGDLPPETIDGQDLPPETIDGEDSSLRSYLNYLKQIDAGRILLARKINRLGFDAAAVLTAHYTAYGSVKHVFVPRSRSVARSQSNRPFVRKRPSGIGFVVMAESQAVDAILQDGEVQSVAGVTVYLQRFRRQSFPEADEEAL